LLGWKKCVDIDHLIIDCVAGVAGEPVAGHVDDLNKR